MIGLTYDEMIALRPCDDRAKAVAKLLGGKTKWNGRKITAAEAVAAGITFNDLVWIASAQALKDKDIERRMYLWLADCAARVLHLYEKQFPGDMRVRNSIIATRAFARGEISKAQLQTAAAECDAARAAAWDAAWDAARAAAWAAARAAAWDAARAAAWDAARAAAWDAARAAAWDAARAAAWDEESAWQLQSLVARLSDPEPADWPLDRPKDMAA